MSVLVSFLGDGVRAMDPMDSLSEEHRLERHVFAAVQTIGDGLILVDRHNLVTYMNPTAERLTGWLLQDALKAWRRRLLHRQRSHSGGRVASSYSDDGRQPPVPPASE